MKELLKQLVFIFVTLPLITIGTAFALLGAGFVYVGVAISDGHEEARSVTKHTL